MRYVKSADYSITSLYGKLYTEHTVVQYTSALTNRLHAYTYS